jgi:hypothetical protein
MRGCVLRGGASRWASWGLLEGDALFMLMAGLTPGFQAGVCRTRPTGLALVHRFRQRNTLTASRRSGPSRP